MSPHRAVFTRLVQEQGWTIGAELGVDKGVLFNMLLMSCPTLHLIGVDTGVVPARRAHCEALAAEFGDRATFHVMTTREASDLVPDRSLDFVFIDADHSEAAVREDIEHWLPKVRYGGWIGGHDYSRHFPGVARAVDAKFKARVKQWPGSIWGVWV